MKRTSPSVRSVRMAARSPPRTSAGPEVIRSPAPISLATMPANVVFPSPGGPAKSRWSTAQPRQGGADLGSDSRPTSPGGRGLGTEVGQLEASLQFDQQAGRRLASDAGDQHQGLDVVSQHGPLQRRRAVGREYGQRQ